ncbi:MAG: hypothetical protein R3F39_19645 [Myxococcota bacterium]
MALAAVAVFAVVLLARPQPAWDAAELDGLAAGAQLADALTTGGGRLRERALRGFAGVPGHPLCVAAPDSLSCRELATDSPLLRWAVAGAALTMPATDDASSAGLGAALALALAAFFAGLLLARHLGLGVGAVFFGAAFVLVLPGALGGASTAGAAAVGALVSALVLLGIERAARGGGGFLPGAAVGLALALHPVGITLLIPLFVCAAIGLRPRPAAAPDAGMLPLPPVALTLFAAPIAALVVFVALWPAAWHDTTRHLGAWMQSGIALRAPAQDILGTSFAQAGGRAPGAATAFLQWVAWTPAPIIAAWVVGVAATARAGRRGLWSPLLVLATVVVAAGLDAGLFGARRNLLAWLWVPTALTASIGVLALGDWWASQRPRMAPNLARGLVAAAVLAMPLVALGLGVEPSGAALVGAPIRTPLPAYSADLGDGATDETSVHVVGSADGYPYALQVLSERGPRAFRWVPTVEGADWVFVVHDRPDVVVEALAGREPRETVYAAGLRVDVYGAP